MTIKEVNAKLVDQLFDDLIEYGVNRQKIFIQKSNSWNIHQNKGIQVNKYYLKFKDIIEDLKSIYSIDSKKFHWYTFIPLANNLVFASIKADIQTEWIIFRNGIPKMLEYLDAYWKREI